MAGHPDSLSAWIGEGRPDALPPLSFSFYFIFLQPILSFSFRRCPVVQAPSWGRGVSPGRGQCKTVDQVPLFSARTRSRRVPPRRSCAASSGRTRGARSACGRTQRGSRRGCVPRQRMPTRRLGAGRVWRTKAGAGRGRTRVSGKGPCAVTGDGLRKERRASGASAPRLADGPAQAPPPPAVARCLHLLGPGGGGDPSLRAARSPLCVSTTRLDTHGFLPSPPRPSKAGNSRFHFTDERLELVPRL